MNRASASDFWRSIPTIRPNAEATFTFSSLRPVSRLFVYLYKRHFPKTMQFCATCTRNRPKHHQNTGGRHEFVHMLLEVNRSLSTVGSLMHVLFACYRSKQTSSLDWNKSFYIYEFRTHFKKYNLDLQFILLACTFMQAWQSKLHQFPVA